ncbi:MAG: 23S rRNA (guanosine(2251)-2'-O)-methyltransferase RlmB [Acidimicrobiales bacterium]|nr:23S rRNA (guanosine(2251)-2'-O)-methyltransferase RlmB [Acidimicrobiales bacterium]
MRGERTDRRGVGGEQVEGRQAVRELLLTGRRRVREVLLAADLDPAPIIDEIIDLADEAKVTVREVSRGRFDATARTEAPQGVLAFAAPLRDLALEELLGPEGADPPFLLLLDGLTDPGNVGAIMRTAECAGVSGVVLPRHHAARVTPTVTKASAGAIEHLPIAQVSSIAGAVARLIELEVWTVGLDMTADQTVHGLDVARGPVALVLGAEGTGLSRLVRERCDLIVNIPLRGRLDSLNVAAAAAVACFEVARVRSSPGA